MLLINRIAYTHKRSQGIYDHGQRIRTSQVGRLHIRHASHCEAKHAAPTFT